MKDWFNSSVKDCFVRVTAQKDDYQLYQIDGVVEGKNNYRLSPEIETNKELLLRYGDKKTKNLKMSFVSN